jgi:hypothetical protein
MDHKYKHVHAILGKPRTSTSTEFIDPPSAAGCLYSYPASFLSP